MTLSLLVQFTFLPTMLAVVRAYDAKPAWFVTAEQSEVS